MQLTTEWFFLLFSHPENATFVTQTTFLWNTVAALCMCAFPHAFTCRHFLVFPRTYWLNSKSYLLGTVPGISLWIVQLCRSGMVTEPRHCTQKYPSWNHMRHRFWCGTETNITSKVNALLNTMQLQGWCLICNKAAYEFTVNSFNL